MHTHINKTGFLTFVNLLKEIIDICIIVKKKKRWVSLTYALMIRGR